MSDNEDLSDLEEEDYVAFIIGAKKRKRPSEIFKKRKRAQVLSLKQTLPSQSKTDLILNALVPLKFREKFEKILSNFKEKVNQTTFQQRRVAHCRQPQFNENTVCKVCQQQTKYVYSQSDVICTKCGGVNKSNMMVESNWLRHFEDDAPDKFQQGGAYQAKMSMSYNLQTYIGSYPSGKKGRHSLHQTTKKLKTYRFKHAGSTSEETRDQKKKEAFQKIDHLCSNFLFSGPVKKMSEILYALHRDDMIKEHNTDEIIASCLIVALEHKNQL